MRAIGQITITNICDVGIKVIIELKSVETVLRNIYVKKNIFGSFVGKDGITPFICQRSDRSAVNVSCFSYVNLHILGRIIGNGKRSTVSAVISVSG